MSCILAIHTPCQLSALRVVRILMQTRTLLAASFAALSVTLAEGASERREVLSKPIGRHGPFHNRDWRKHLNHRYVMLRSACHPAWMLRAKSPQMRCFSRGTQKGDWGPPSFVVLHGANEVRAVRPGQTVSGTDLASPWLLASFAGSPTWDYFDAPYLLVLQRRPTSISLSGDGLLLEFDARDTGWIGAMPLYGFLKLPQKASPIRTYPCIQRGWQSWTWDQRLPATVQRQCDFWASTIRAFPAGLQEYFAVDDAGRSVVVRQLYDFMETEDDWGTEATKFAAVPPTLGLALAAKQFPLEFSAPLHDPQLMTPYGPLLGALGVDRLDITYEGPLQYVHEHEKLGVPPAGREVTQQALLLLREAMRKQFPSADTFRHDYGGAGNFCWAIQGYYWYPLGLAFLDDPGLMARAKASMRKYLDEFVLQRERYSPHRGMLILHGPGIGSWGRWGDAGKFSTNIIRTLWPYAHYTGDIELIKERWPLIKRLFVMAEEVGWTGVGRRSIAEMGDEAPPCLAMARLAHLVGDQNTCDFACYLFVRELVHHVVKSVGSQYFYDHQPHNRDEPMPRDVFLTNLWGETAGWQIDGPAYPRHHGERQYTNRWMRFHDLDVARFHRDVLSTSLQDELTNTETLLPLWAGRYGYDSPHIKPSYIRLRSLLLNDSPEKLASLVPPKAQRRYQNSDHVAAMVSYLRTASPGETVQVVKPVERPLRFFPGVERKSDRETCRATAQAVFWSDRYPLAPRWLWWGQGERGRGGRRRDRSFGTFDAFPGTVMGRSAMEQPSFVSELWWFDPVEPGVRTAKHDDADRRWKALEWSVFGPLPNTEDDLPDALSFAPEKRIDMGMTLNLATGEAKWRRARTIETGAVDVAGALGLGKKRSSLRGAYVLGYVRVDEPRDLVLRLGNSGGIRVWVNDEFRHFWHQHSKWRDARIPVSLKRGWNKLLLLVGHGWSPLHVRIDIETPDGLPFTKWDFSPTPPTDR